MAKKNAAAEPARAVGFTDTRRVQELVDLMVDNGLTELELVEDKSRIMLRRGAVSSGSGGGAVMAPMMVTAPTVQAPAAPKPAVEEEELLAIKSPMVGTFYAAPSPTSEPYVAVGAAVNEKTIVCIVEAMKVLNQIHAEISGTIARILVSNGQTVEFGQTLFLVKPG